VRNPVYSTLHPLFEKIFSPLATSAPMKRIFSHSGLIMWPNRARVGDTLLYSWFFCGAIIPCKYCYWNRDVDIMFLVSCLDNLTCVIT